MASLTGLGAGGFAVMSVDPVDGKLTRLAAVQGRAGVTAALKSCHLHLIINLYIYMDLS